MKTLTAIALLLAPAVVGQDKALLDRAEKGDADAQVTLGAMYETAQGVPQDFAEAVRWYRKSADQGNASAQACLGAMFDAGRGVPQDYVSAHMWYNIAASRASGAGQKRYAAARDVVAEKMTAQQIAEARRRAREWKPAKVAR